MHYRIALVSLLLVGANRAAAQDACHSLEPKTLPSVGALFDSAALASRLPAGTLGDASELQITIVTIPKPHGYIVNSDPADTTASGVIGQILATLRPSRSAPPAFRLYVTFGATPAMVVAHSQLCDPVAITQPAQISYRVATPAGTRPERPRSVTPRIRLGENGEVLRVDLGGGTGDSQLDRLMQQSLQSQRWRAATLDGRAISVVVTGKKVEIAR